MNPAVRDAHLRFLAAIGDDTFVPRHPGLTRGCRSARQPSRLHQVYQRGLDVVSVLWVSFVVWCLVVIFLGVGA